MSSAESDPTPKGPSLETVWTVVTPAGIFILASLFSIAPNDFWWHLRTGGIILAQHHIPRTDLFTFSQFGKPWINQAWLSEVLLHVIHSIGGLSLVVLIHALLITFGYTLVLRTIAPRTGIRAASIATFVGVLVGFGNWNVRPQVASIAAFAILVAILDRHRTGHERAIWWTIPLFALWANLHGGFIFGVAALGLYVVGRAIDVIPGVRGSALPLSPRGEGQGVRGLIDLAKISSADLRSFRILVTASLLAIAALSLNPEGPAGLVRYVAGFFESKTTMNLTVEFAPIVIREPDGLVFFASLLLVLLLVRGQRFRSEWSEILPLFAFVVLTLFARRGAPWYGLLLIPLLGRLVAARWSREKVTHGSSVINSILIAAAIVWIAIALPWWRGRIPSLGDARPILSPDTPVESTAFLCRTIPAGTRGYSDQTFASYQIAACPALPVFVDTRVELFPASQWSDYIAIWSARWDWQQIVDRWRMRYLFLDIEEQADLVRAATASPNWRQLYRDGQAAIFVKAP